MCLRDIDSVIGLQWYSAHSTTTVAEMGSNAYAAYQLLQELSGSFGKLRKFRGRCAGCTPNRWWSEASWFIVTWHALGKTFGCTGAATLCIVHHYKCLHEQGQKMLCGDVVFGCCHFLEMYMISIDFLWGAIGSLEERP